MSHEIPAEILLPLIEERPELWDRSREIYKDLATRTAAWKEIAAILNPSYASLSNADKECFCKAISSKWSNLRDAFIKAERKYKENKAKGLPCRPYVYRHKIKFFTKYVGYNRKAWNVNLTPEVTVSEESSSDSDAELPNSEYVKNKRIKLEIEEDMSHSESKNESHDCHEQSNFMSMDTQREESHHLSFFRGIMPAIVTFDDDETLELQAGVLELVRKIRKKRKDPL